MDIGPNEMAILAGIALFIALCAQAKWVKAVSGRRRDTFRYGGLAVGLILLYLGGWSAIDAAIHPAQAPGPNVPVVTPTACGAACPTSGSSAVAITVQNTLDTSAATTYDVTMLCQADGSAITLTDTTAPTAVDFNCGKLYTCKIQSTAGAGGDASIVDSILSGSGATVTADKNLQFTACNANQAFLVGSEQHGIPESRVWDNINAGWMYVAGSTTDWSSADPVTYDSTINGSSTYNVGVNGELHVTYHIRAANSYQDLNDRGLIVLVKAPVGEFDTTKTVAKINGQVVANSKGNLNSDENTAYDSYQYAFVYSGDQQVTKSGEITVELDMFAAGGVDPSTDVDVDMAMVGQYASTLNALSYKVGSVKDDSTKTTVYTLWNSVLNIA